MSEITFAEIKHILKTLSESQADAQAKAAAEMTALRASQAKTDLALTRLEKQVGGIAQSQGDAAEEFFFNSLTVQPTIGDIRYDRVFNKVYGGPQGQQQEYDLILVNGNAVAIVEVKYKASIDAIKQVQTQLGLYRQHFPQHKKFKLYAGIAGMSVPTSVATAAQKKGFFVLKAKGEVLEVDAQNMQAF